MSSALCLKPHRVREKSTGVTKQIALPVDIEVHIGSDGRVYMLDAARLCPPTGRFPGVVVDYHFLTNHFRPELLLVAAKVGVATVSSDALSKFGKAGCV